ncbi:MAG: tetratricopeptide repeat protein [Ktedonobacteraceae bacterium]|nr:tetratricopeptide repeat protein [Ktedonobacteraceae bacterium]
MAQITLRDYLQETEDAIRDDRIDDAFTHCRNILAHFPESLEAQRLLGEAYLAQGQLEEAQQSFDWILTNDPENIVAYCNRALISERALDYDTALDCYQQAYELSHGNSQIRQEFNRLSSETQQPGFMFSRAGLARLYMRGDLLTQAIQEWEAVLATSPDRLDARTGLLETYWREAHYDRVEQLATQILQDVPGCLKPLLLLAYVASTTNMIQAQELLKRAEGLDPDLLMAQELFSDFMARQPAEPFLQLLKKAPASLDTSLPPSLTTSGSNLQAPLTQSSDISAPSMSPQALAAWNDINLTAAENDITLIKGTQDKQQAQEAFSAPVWSADAAPARDVWSVLDGMQDAGSPPDVTSDVHQLGSRQPQPASPQQQEQSPETWLPEPSASATPDINQNLFPWDSPHQYEGLKEQSLSDLNTWENVQGPVSESGIWGTSSKEGSMASPPVWLNMLTQSEIRQLSDGDVQMPSPVEIPAASSPSVQPTWKDEAASITKPAVDDEDAFSFGPAWLKSLGAASLEDEAASAEASPALSSSPSLDQEAEKMQPSSVSQAYEPQPGVSETSESRPQMRPFSEEKVAEPVGTNEHNLLTTLEGLEAGLRSQGFVPLEPNSLQAIAKSQEAASSTVPKTPELTTQRENTYQNESLPSAFAELGSFSQEPAWLASLNAVPASSPQPSWSGAYTPPGTSPLHPAPEETYSVQPTQPLPGIPSRPQEQKPARENDVPDSSISGTAQPEQSQVNRPQEVLATQTPVSSAYSGTGAQGYLLPGNDFLFNNELETTMKRPAVRLQPIPQDHSFAQNDSMSSPNRSRRAEQTYSGRTAEGNLSYQERLLKGYQHQLVGDYDEAMQEYRVIIRNSPELLSEVVSNVRALLKLAPKYSTGYRVLGDAYMRQGEYLQAMEAYNKALTMAKRAKS